MPKEEFSELSHLYEVLLKKEQLLTDIVDWLKRKKLWEQFQEETGWKIKK